MKRRFTQILSVVASLFVLQTLGMAETPKPAEAAPTQSRQTCDTLTRISPQRSGGSAKSIRRSYLVPVEYAPELDGSLRQIKAHDTTLTSIRQDLSRILQQADADQAQFEQTLGQVAEGFRAEQQMYEQKLQEIQSLACERAREFQAWVRQLQPCPYDPPAQYDAKVMAYNDAVRLLRQDRQELVFAKNQLLGELDSIRNTAASTLAQMRQALADNQQAHQRNLNSRVAQYNTTVDTANALIRTYNTKLQSYGRLVHSRLLVN